MKTTEEAKAPKACTTCGHPTPHKRLGPIRDNNGFQHSDACEECDCINDPRFKALFPEPCPTCQTTHAPSLTCGEAATLLRTIVPQARIAIDVRGCARCEGDHSGLIFREFRQPPEDVSHWATCANTGEPILMSIVVEPEGSRHVAREKCR